MNLLIIPAVMCQNIKYFSVIFVRLKTKKRCHRFISLNVTYFLPMMIPIFGCPKDLNKVTNKNQKTCVAVKLHFGNISKLW